MIGLDTNILVRFVTRDDDEQWQLVDRYLKANCSSKQPGWISCIVLCEMVWVLARGYDYSKEEILRLLRQLLLIAELTIQEHDSVRSAMKDFENGKADFSDYLIGHLNAKHGCETTVTLDLRAADHSTFTLLAP
jgi:predicted nucleic-acid-binding protein